MKVIEMGLLNFLRSNLNARKVFGKKELKIIEKQLSGIALMQSEKNRLSRDIRPKLEFVKAASEFEEEFGLKKNQENRKLIEKTTGAVLNDDLGLQVEAILLFGSFADNSFTQRSDIDICVVFKKDLSLKEATKFRIRVASQVPEKIDIQVFNTLPQKIKRDIARNHKVLYKSKGYDNVNFSVRYLKDCDYFIRMNKIFGAE